MANEGLSRGRQTFSLRTDERPRGVGAPTLPPSTRETLLPPAQKIPLTEAIIDGIIKTREIDASPKKNKKKGKLIVGSVALAALTGAAAIGVWGLNRTSGDESTSTTTQSQSVDSLPNNFKGSLDSNADKQIAKVGVNARPISDNEALALAKENPPQLLPDEFPTLPLVFIGKLTNGGEAIIETDYVDQAYNPIAQKPDRLNSGKEITFTKAGTEIALSLEEFEVFQVDPLIVKDTAYFAGLLVRFNDPLGVQYTISINTPEDIRHLEPMEIIKNAPIVDYKNIKDQKGQVMNGPVSILKTTRNNTRVRIGGSPILKHFPKGLPANITFITQNNQLVFPQ